MPLLGRAAALTLGLLLPLAACAPDTPSAAEASTAPALEGPLNEANDPAADSLVRAWIGAIGGMEIYWELESARYALHTELYDTATGRLKRNRPRYVTLARGPDGERARIERWEGNDFIQHGFDGEQAWAVMNGERLAPGDKDYDEAAYVSSDVNYWIALPYKLADPGVRLHDDGTDEEGRRVVRVTFGEGVGDHQDTWWYRFEPGRTWPVEVAYREDGRENVNRLSFQDIRTVDGYTFVGSRVHVNDDDKVWKILRTTDFERNPELEEGVFRSPLGGPSS